MIDEVPPPPASDVVLSRDKIRSGRHREVRAVTLNLNRLPKRDRVHLRIVSADEAFLEQHRPRTRGDCVDGLRPCPFVGCSHNLYLDVSGTGNLKLNFPDIEPDEMKHSCALDVANEGGVTLEGVAIAMNMTRERIRQIEAKSLGRLARLTTESKKLRDFLPDGELVKARRLSAGVSGLDADDVEQPDQVDDDVEPPLEQRIVHRNRPELVTPAQQPRTRTPRTTEEPTTMGQDLTERQQKLVAAIRTLTKKLGRAPRSVELGEEAGVTGSTTGATRQAVIRELLPLRGDLVEWGRGAAAGVVLLDGSSPLPSRAAPAPRKVTVTRKPKAKREGKPRGQAARADTARVVKGEVLETVATSAGDVSVSEFLSARRAKLVAELAVVDKLDAALEGAG